MEWPQRAAVGPTDTLARIPAQRMTVRLGQSIVIENVSGASGNPGDE
jgi:tripartite-type tricarboxylate transporter receptor subunit TctC